MSYPKRAMLFVLSATLVSSTAEAGEIPIEPDIWEPVGDHEWSSGVSQERREAARALFQSGHELLHDSVTITAAEKFLEALKVWDHPGIHYNLALALMSLDRPIELREHLIAAMRYGPWPLKQHRFEHAKNFKTVLESQLVQVRIRCDVRGAKVTLDGQELFAPPGEIERWAKAGHHVISASKVGFMANQVARSFTPGARVAFELKLSTQAELTTYDQRWPPGVPWSFIGGGAAVALAGGGLYYAARVKAIDADNSVANLCPNGCASQPAGDAAKRTQLHGLRTAAISAFALGGAALATGVVLGVVNRAHATVRQYEPDVAAATKPIVSLAPMLDNSAHGVVAVGRF